MNHLDLVGWINTFRYKWAELTGREIKFKPATFYLGVADHIARNVEGQNDELNEEGNNSSVADPNLCPGSSKVTKEDDVITAETTMAGEGVTTVEGIERHHPEIVHKIDSPSPSVSNPINEN